MGITYTQPTDLDLLDPEELSRQLSSTIRSAVPWLVTLSNADASLPEREGKWSAKEVVGHLTDSAVNNLSRIVRMQIAFELPQRRHWHFSSNRSRLHRGPAPVRGSIANCRLQWRRPS
jgi:hypothetical protein